MLNFNLPEPELLKAVLGPLLEDFQYWFTQARSRLESQQLVSLSPEQQSDLLTRVKQAQQEVSAAQSLFQIANGQIGIDTSLVMAWHQLVKECWQVALSAQLGKPDSSQ